MRPSFAIAHKLRNEGRRRLVKAAISAIYAGNGPAALGCMITLDDRMRHDGESFSLPPNAPSEGQLLNEAVTALRQIRDDALSNAWRGDPHAAYGILQRICRMFTA